MTDFASLAADVHAIREALEAAPTPPVPVLTVTSTRVLPHGTSDHNPVEWKLSDGAASWVTRTANVQGTDPDAEQMNVVKTVLTGADEVTWNELKHGAVRDYLHGYDDQTRTIRVVEIAVTWRTDVFDLVDWTYERANTGILHVTPERGVLSVLLRHKATGLLHWRVCTHVVQHIEVNGRARVIGQITGQNARGKHHIALIASSAVAHAAGGVLITDRSSGKDVKRTVQAAPVFGSGDLNVDYKADLRQVSAGNGTDWFPVSVIGSVADITTPNAHGGTHGSRLIDWGWLLP